MNWSRGVLGAHPGRVTVRIRLPQSLVEMVSQQSDSLSVCSAVLLGNLVGSALPEALAEAAHEVLDSQISTSVTMPSALAEGISDSISAQDSVDQILPGGGNEPMSGGHAGTP